MLGLCVFLVFGATEAQSQTKVTVGQSFVNPAAAGFWVGKHLGLFARHGLDVTIVQITGATLFGCAPETLLLQNGALSDGRNSVPYSEVIARHFGLPGGELIGRGMYRGERGGPLGGIAPFWEVGMGGAEVEVNRETGTVRLKTYVSVADVGKAINPRECEAQDEGAAVMGLGHTFFEQMVYEDGQLLNPTLIDYRVPVMGDLPDEFHSIIVENGDGPGPYGAKGIGEGGIMPIAPAVANAIADATDVRIRDLPLTPERVWRALEESPS